ncbi:carbohydrate kinase family protein [Mariniphaga sp.]|uniref:carbohydrate kinase family protein n=1 Tax=Mariniphaga sp. TaxID=1954475 RepID=UPI003567B5C2
MKKLNVNTIVCFGEVLWDMLPTGAKPGGAPLNVAIHLKRQELNPFIISSVGNDADGQKLQTFLQETGMNLEYLQTDDVLPTSQVLVHLDSEKNATYEICEPVAWDNIQFNKKMENLAEKADLIVFGTLASRNETTRKNLLKFLKHSPAKRFLDVNLRPPYDTRDVVEEMLHLADFAKLNNEELATIALWNDQKGTEEELVRWLSEYFSCTIVCVTRGANGAALLKNNTWIKHPGFKVIAVDTVGSGDSFLAGLIAQLSAESSPEKALEYACATGAFVASRQGAVPEYSVRDIEAFMK